MPRKVRRAGPKGATGVKGPRGLRALRISPRLGNLGKKMDRQSLKRGVTAVNRRALLGSSVTSTELDRMIKTLPRSRRR